jgi:hypothetical protein
VPETCSTAPLGEFPRVINPLLASKSSVSKVAKPFVVPSAAAFAIFIVTVLSVTAVVIGVEPT